MVEIFLSYCWSDDEIADGIYDKLSMNKGINLHRDKIDIKPWKSIKEYMQSISNMDYTILLISDAYLKSANCMYEVLEIMHDRVYKEKIFPAVVYKGIYKPQIRAQYVRYWQEQCAELEKELATLESHNLGSLVQDLKQRKDIASNVADFLSLVAELNNPQIADVATAISQKLQEKNLISSQEKKISPLPLDNADYFKKLQISKPTANCVTDLDIHRHMLTCFENVNSILAKLCKQLERESPIYSVIIEPKDSRTVIYTFYKVGKSVKKLKIFLDESFGQLSIGVSDNTHIFSNGKSYNEMYNPQLINGNIVVSGIMNMNGRETLDDEGITKDVWKRFIAPYI